MRVKDYYYAHFSELSPEKQFHFATRIKNYFKTHDFDDYLKNNQPDANLAAILKNNDYSRVNNFAARKPFFEKYTGIYGVEAALFRVHHLLKEYDLDLREDFLKIYPKTKLYKLCDRLMMDEEALKILSTWAINVVCLTEELFPREENIIKYLSEYILKDPSTNTDPTLIVYYCTHIIICASEFYTKNLENSKNLDIMKKLLEKCSKIISKNINTISLDAAIEFLVCCNLIGVEYPELRQKIKQICNDFRKDSPYLINYRRDNTPGSYFHTLNGAEHINVLYIMSGLDSE